MKILQLCAKPPLPAIDGGCVANYRLTTDLLRAGYDVRLLSLATPKHPFLPEVIDPGFMQQTQMDCVFVDTKASPLTLLANLFTSRSVQQARFHHPAFVEKIKKVLAEEQFDAILFVELMTCFYLDDVRKLTNIPCLYRSLNTEWMIVELMAKRTSNPLKRWYLRLQAERMKKFELETWKKLDFQFTISTGDAEEAAQYADPEKVRFLPFTLDFERKKPTGEANTVFHLGAMDWKPNVDGVIWFVENVWPLVLKIRPHTQLHLGGKNIASVADQLAGENITVHPIVKDARAFMRQYRIMAVPIHSGSGTRVKILEGMAEGNVITSTKRGVFGMGLNHGEHAMLADEPHLFAGNIVELMENQTLQESMVERGFDFLKANHSSEAVAEMLDAWQKSTFEKLRNP